MKIYNVSFLKFIYPKVITKGINNFVYITIDDGPSASTPYLLEELDKLGIKATFFVVGQNVEKYPAYYKMILDAGHLVGNHSYLHKSVFSIGSQNFLKDIERAERIIHSNLFRPPYGYITFPVYKKISAFYQIILWSYMTYDFANHNNIDHRKIKPTTILVLHDNYKFLKTTILHLRKIKNIVSEKRLEFSVL